MAKRTKKIKEEIDNTVGDIVSGLWALNPNATPLSGLDSLFNNNRWMLLSNLRQVLSQMYVEHGLVQHFIDVPVDDAFRGGYDIISRQLSAEDVKELEHHMDSQNVMGEICLAVKWSRLFGGAGIVIMTAQDHATKLDLNNLERMEIKAADMWELFYSLQNVDDEQKKLTVGTNKDFVFDYYGQKLHNSRALLLKGKTPPSFIKPRLRGWGLSVVEALVQSINQHLKTKNLTYEVLDEFKLDIFKVKGFNQALISKNGITKIQNMIALVNQSKNYQNAIILDTEDEHQSKQLTFTGLSEVMSEIRMQIAADVRMPMTKLFGISAAGFNSGEDDIEVYNGMIESSIRMPSKPLVMNVVALYCQKLFGFIPKDLDIEYRPLRMLSSEQEENVKTSKLNRIVLALEKGLCSTREAKESINQSNLLPMQIDVEQENIAEPISE